MRSNSIVSALAGIFMLALFVSPAAAQKRKHRAPTGTDSARAVLFERKDISQQDLLLGPGGRAMMPDLEHIQLLEDKKGGYSKKFRIRDGSGREWVAKIGREAQPETVAVRLLSAIGYKTEINYLVPRLTIPGRGTFTNVRLEARPDGVKRGKAWSWGKTPFEGTREMQGLKLMMAFLNNWDMKGSNNVIISNGRERQYVISDLGATFGKTGSNSLPLFWRFGRSRNNPGDYVKSSFITGVNENRVKVHFNGKNRGQLSHITVADARWLGGLLSQLSGSQIRDAFRAANYSDSDVERLARAVEQRISQLEQARPAGRIANLR